MSTASPALTSQTAANATMEPTALCACGHTYKAHLESDNDGKRGCYFAYNCDCRTFSPLDPPTSKPSRGKSDKKQ